MKYQVSKMADLSCIDNVEIKNYDNVIIPVDELYLEKIVSGQVKIDCIDKDIYERLLQEIEIKKFKAEKGKSIWVSKVFDGKSKSVIMLYGVGCLQCKTDLKTNAFLANMEKIGGKMFNPGCLQEKILLVCDYVSFPEKFTHSSVACAMALGFMQAAYRFDKYFTTESSRAKLPKFKSLALFVSNAHAIGEEVKNVQNILNSLYFVRDMVNEPANVIYPESYANIICEFLHDLPNLTVKVLGAKELTDIGMDMLLGVGIGSVKESKVVVIEYKGNEVKTEYDAAFLGKGVTFDTGGISIKPAKGMEDMKGDMAGSATVVGLMHLLASRKAKANVVGVVGLVENMCSGSAQRPGDIVKSLSGKTVEVLNTDAEGRLVLGDILYYTATKYNPNYMVDLATLTGAIVVALGSFYAGMYSNSDELAEMLQFASVNSGEDVWRMPLDERFAKMNESTFADLRNVTNTGEGGSITAAQFLQEFIGGAKNWAHLDIAGVSDVSQESPIAQRGCSTAFGVKLLNRFVIDNLEAE